MFLPIETFLSVETLAINVLVKLNNYERDISPR